MSLSTLRHSLRNWGVERYQTKEEIERNTLINIVILYFIGVLFSLDALALYIFFEILLPANAEKYSAYVWPYFGSLGYITIWVIGGFFLRKYWRNLDTWFRISQVGTFVFIAFFAALLGPGTHFHYFTLQLLPTPFLFYHWKERRKLLGAVVTTTAVILGITIFTHVNDALYPLPEYVEAPVRIITWGATLVTVLIVMSYFWTGSRKAEDELRAQDAEIQQELDFAQDIQKGIIPQQIESWNNLEIDATYLPLGKVSGDYFDVFRTDEALYILITDISGHGVPAAFVTMLAKQTFSSLVNEGRDPAEIMYEANNDIVSKLQTPEYLTAFLMRVDKNLNMHYCNGGHVPPLYYSSERKSFAKLDSDGFVLGALPRQSTTFGQKELLLSPGDRLYLFTDGITEQRNSEREHFGNDRFMALLDGNLTSPIRKVHDDMQQQLNAFRGDYGVEDDVTFLTIEVG